MGTSVKRLAAVVFALLVAVPQSARAAIVFAYGVESCQSSIGDVGTYIFQTAGTTPGITVSKSPRVSYCSNSANERGKSCTTNADCAGGACWTETGNNCELSFPLTSSVNQWLSVGSEYISSPQSSMQAHVTIDVPTIYGNGDTSELLRFEQSNGEKGCFLEATVLQGGQGGSEYQLNLFYNDKDRQCVGGTNAGTECQYCTSSATCGGGVCQNAGSDPGGACDNQCNYQGANGEQWCLANTAASDVPLTKNRRYEVVVQQNNLTVNTVECVLIEGGIERGRTTYLEGRCAATVDDSKRACATNADCSGEAYTTCTSSHITSGTTAAISGVTFGAKASPTGSFSGLKMDDFIVATGTSDPISAVRFQDSVPDSSVSDGLNGSKTGCSTNNYNCVKEANTTPYGSDTNTSHVLSGTQQSDKTDEYTISDIATATGDYATTPVLAVATHLVMQDNSLSSPGGQACKSCIKASGGSALCGSAEVIAGEGQWVPCGLSVQSSSALDTVAEINSANMQAISANASCTSSCGNDLSTAVTESVVRMTVPSPPNVAKDYNNDGFKHFRVTGDSTVNAGNFKGLVAAALQDFDTVSFCTAGGTTIGDIESDITNIANGGLGGPMSCKYSKGAANTPVDFLLIMSGANTLSWPGLAPNKYCGTGADRGKTCAVNADCAGSVPCVIYQNGYCRGGADHGKACLCPRASNWVSSSSTACYSANANSTGSLGWLGTAVCATAQSESGKCSTNANCDTKIPCTVLGDCPSGATACTSSTCRGTCTSGQCTTTNYSETSPVPGNTMAPPSWGMPGCINRPECNGGLCWSAGSEVDALNGIKHLWSILDARTGTGASCANCKIDLIAGIQPSGPSWVGTTFNPNRPLRDSYGATLKETAEATGHDWLDLDTWFNWYCHDPDRCYSDTIHWNAEGLKQATAAIKHAMLNEGGYVDGTCSDSLCVTLGKVGDVCDSSDQCAFYHAKVANPPLSWSQSFPMVIGMNEVGSGTSRVDASNSGSLGSACLMTSQGSNTCGANADCAVAFSTTNAMEGLRNAYYTNALAHQEWFSNSNNTCVDSVGTGSQGDKTWMTWWYPSQSQTTTIMSDYSGTSGFKMTMGADRKVSCTVGPNGTPQSATSTTVLTLATFYHLACVYDDAAQNVKLYVNGHLEATSASVNMADSGGTTFSLGINDSANEISGRTDEVASINQALSAERICRIASCGISGSQAGGCGCSQADLTTYSAWGRYAATSGQGAVNCCLGVGAGGCTTPVAGTIPAGLPDCNTAAP